MCETFYQHTIPPDISVWSERANHIITAEFSVDLLSWVYFCLHFCSIETWGMTVKTFTESPQTQTVSITAKWVTLGLRPTTFQPDCNLITVSQVETFWTHKLLCP